MQKEFSRHTYRALETKRSMAQPAEGICTPSRMVKKHEMFHVKQFNYLRYQ